MKAIGYVLGDFPVLSETFISTEIRAMSEQGYQVLPLAFRKTPEQCQPCDATLAEQTQAITEVSTLNAVGMWLRSPARTLSTLAFIIRQTGLPKASLIKACGQVAWLAKTQQCQHLHAHFALHTAATAIAAAKLSGLTVSFVGHGYDVYAKPRDLKLKLQAADFSVAVCEDMQQTFQRLSPKRPVHLIACGINPTRYPFQPVTEHNGSLLFIGRLTEKKGLPDLLRALWMIPENKRPSLDIVGDGHLKVDLIELATELGLTRTVRFLGAQPSEWIIDNAAHYMALCTPFCEASNGDKDTGPVVVKEAMALGLPVICTDFMGCKEILSADSGYLVPPNQPADLARTILEVKQLNADCRLALTQRARARVATLFSATVSGSKLAHAIEGAL